MRALIFEGTRSVVEAGVDDPSIEQSSDVIVRVDAAGLCGSDLHVFRGLEPGLDPGTPMGHEVLGTIVAVGSSVSRWREGDRVVAPFSTACGVCFHCARGLSARCESGQLFGWIENGVGLAGCQAELVRVPLADTTLVAVPDELASDVALLAGDVAATGWFAVANAGRSTSTKDPFTIAVVGCGAVGVAAVAAARSLGAQRVFAADPAPDRRLLVERFGAEAIDPGATGASGVAAVLEATHGRGVDAVVEAVGSPAATRLAFELVRVGGTISAVGVHHEAALSILPGELYDKNLTYRAGRCPARSLLDRSLALVAEREFPWHELISHRLSLQEGPSAYAAFDRREPGWTKVVFQTG